MAFLLSDQNVFQYLIEQKMIQPAEQQVGRIESKACKNFNLLVHISGDRSLLIKQEPHDQEGNTNGDFLNEWQVYQLLQTYPELRPLQSLFPEAIHFDAQHSILALNYLKNYCDLEDFYSQSCRFSRSIAAALGAALAKVHRLTFDRQDYRDFLTQPDRLDDDNEVTDMVPDWSHSLDKITPEIFGKISTDGIKFYELYQRYGSLGQAIRQLNAVYEPICLIHNDLKLNNILWHHDGETLRFLDDRNDPTPPESLTNQESPIRFIDWEKWLWGDPASDLGTLVASYLKIWLKRLVVTAGIDLDTALRLAPIPLEGIQPSIATLIQSYLTHFPEILERFPDFLQRIMQFTGLALIDSIQAKLHYREPFGNTEICMLQVAKTLLCQPLPSVPTVCGVTASDVLNLSHPLLLRPVQWQGTPPCAIEHPAADIVPCEPGDRLPIGLTSEAMLRDLVNHIQIKRNFWIAHSHYPPATPPPGVADRLSQLSAELQHNYLKIQLQNYLYDLYFSGEATVRARGEEGHLSHPPTLENNTVRGVNVQFYEQLHRSNRGTGYFDPGWRVLGQSEDGSWAVQKDALTIHIEPERHLQAGARSLSVGDWVAVHLPRHQIEAEFYVAVGNAGIVPDEATAIEFYFNLTPAQAIDLMGHLTQRLNAIGIPFAFKVLSDPVEYGRYDAGVLQVERSQYDLVRQILQPIYSGAVPNSRHTTIPLFTKPLAPGLGLAEEPEDDTARGFGMDRCQRVAEALLSVWQTQTDSPEARMNAIAHHFRKQGLDWQHPYLNPGAQDRYSLFNERLTING